MTNNASRLGRPSSRQLLARVLDDPALVATVQSLRPRVLGKLIRHIGLEDCGEIVSLATTEQIKLIFDEDLWKTDRPGKDETFDADRFALWLEVMLEAGEDFVAEKLIELPEDLVTFAFHSRILVIQVDALAVEMNLEGDYLTDKALESCLSQEIADYHVISRQCEGWDALLAILLALDKHDHAFLERILARCFAMSADYIEENGGLYDVLTSDELLEADMAGDREDRRAGEGFIAPSSAASFLGLCRIKAPAEVMAEQRDAVTRAYFRNLSTPSSPPGAGGREPARSEGGAAHLEALLGTFDEDGEIAREAKPKALLGSKATVGASLHSELFRTTLLGLAGQDSSAHALRMEELAYLCNVLVAGCSINGRSFRPFEGVVAVTATCNLGLEHLVTKQKGTRGARALSERAISLVALEGAEKIFRVGFALLHSEVSMATCAALARVFAARAQGAKSPPARLQMDRGAKFLQEKYAQGKPWFARSRLRDLALEDHALAAVEGLLAEFPFLHGAVLNAHGGRYELDGESQFIATAEQVAGVTTFLEVL